MLKDLSNDVPLVNEAILVLRTLIIGIVLANASEVRVENVSIDNTTYYNKYEGRALTWGVRGMGRNMENHPIKGYVKMKFLTSGGDIVKSVSAYVNDGDPINPGQAGSFEYWTNREDFDGVRDFQVIFRDM